MTRAKKAPRGGVRVALPYLPTAMAAEGCEAVALVEPALDNTGRFGPWLEAPRGYPDEGL